MLEGLGLFLRELAGLDELVHERLIARDLHERVAAEDVAARVADLREEEDVVDEGGAVTVVPMPRRERVGLASWKMRSPADSTARTRRRARSSRLSGRSPRESTRRS